MRSDFYLFTQRDTAAQLCLRRTLVLHITNLETPRPEAIIAGIAFGLFTFLLNYGLIVQ